MDGKKGEYKCADSAKDVQETAFCYRALWRFKHKLYSSEQETYCHAVVLSTRFFASFAFPAATELVSQLSNETGLGTYEVFGSLGFSAYQGFL